MCRCDRSKTCDWQIKGSDALTQTRLRSQSVLLSRLGDWRRRAEGRGFPQRAHLVDTVIGKRSLRSTINTMRSGLVVGDS